MSTAVITGASRGLGRALAQRLVREGWEVIITGRDEEALADAAQAIGSDSPEATRRVRALAGDVTDPQHRTAIGEAIGDPGRLELLVNNASELGPSPLPELADLSLQAFRDLLETNTVAPLALFQALLPSLELAGGTVINLSSDAAIEPYPGWGGYGASKAALDHLSAILAAENPTLAIHAFDPGDMRTDMHQAAFPGEDISDRPSPTTVVPALLHLISARPPSGRHRAVELLAGSAHGDGILLRGGSRHEDPSVHSGVVL